MANEFIKSTKIKPAIIGTIADPDIYNQNIGGQSTGAIVPINANGEFVDGNIGDESLNTNGALITDIKLRTGGLLKIYDNSGVLISSVNFEEMRGAIVSFAMSTPPSGWLECNGVAISRGTYASLFALIGTTWGVGNGSTTFNIPDFRGEFLRGWDHGRGVDSGRSFASYQSDAFQGHKHSATLNGPIYKIGNGGGAPQVYVGSDAGLIGNPTGNGINGAPRTSSETRPRNKSVLYCIKY